MKKRTLFAMAACSLMISACTPPKKTVAPAPDTPPVTRLTVLPLTPLAPGKPSLMESKIGYTDDRNLVTDEQLIPANGHAVQFVAVDPALADIQLLYPEKSGTPGLYRFSFTPHGTTRYRFFAHVNLKPQDGKKQSLEEFPATDIGGMRHPGAIMRAESHQVTLSGVRYALATDKPLRAGDESVLTITANGKEAGGDLIGIYDDLRHLVYLRQEKDHRYRFTPPRAGYLKLLLPVGNQLVPFGVNVAKAE